MSTYKSISQVIQETEYWIRLSVLLQGPLKNALLQVLHNSTNNPAYTGLPINPVDLYNVLSTFHLTTLNKLQKDNILKKDQMKLLLPTNGNATHSDKFDITLIVVLIINCTTLPAPVNGWKTYPLPTDNSIAANVIRAREWRNFLNHVNASDIDGKIFQEKWDDGVGIITNIGYHSPDMKKFKTISLDPKHELVLQSLFSYINKITTKQQQQHNIDLTAIQNQQTAMQIQQTKHDQDIGNLKKKISTQEAQNDQEDKTIEVPIHQIADTSELSECVDNQTELELSGYGSLFNQLQFISKEVEHLNKLKLEEPEVPKNETAELSQICCREVLVHVANNIQNEWSQFLGLMTVPKSEREQMKSNNKTSADNVMDYFKAISYQVRWIDLKQILLTLEKHQIVDYIETNTLITQGLQIASNKLKQQYIDDLLNWYIEQPLSDKNIDILREEGYVDVTILSSTTVDHEWSKSDRETLMQQNFLQFESVDLDKIFEINDQMVVIRGVAGIGKSTLIQMYTLKWAKGEILKKIVDKSSIDFLFAFTCREMNTFSNIESLEDLLKKKYSEIFDYVTFSDLQSIANRIMIIVDGFDELQGVYEENSKPTFEAQESISKLVKDIIDTRCEALKGHKTITLGRPKACEFIKKQFSGTQKIKMVEVCGFNKNMVVKYVKVFFKNDATKAEKVLELISKSKDLKTMANVPIFLWVICMVYGEELIAEEIKTVTELYVYGFLVFLQNHLQDGNTLNNRKLQDMANDPSIGEIVLSLAKLSMKTYMKHQVVFTDQDIKTVHCPIHLEQTGFIVKHSIGKMNIETYQFKHLAFQEFLCALYLCLVKGASRFNTNRELSSCTPTIIGIYYLRKGKKNQLFMDLYENLKNTKNKYSTLKNALKSPIAKVSHSLYIRNCLKWSGNIINFIGEDKILHFSGTDFVFQEFLRNIHESGYYFSEEHLKMVKDVSGVNLSLENYNANDAKYTLQLLEALQINKISEFNFIIRQNEEENEQSITALWKLAIDCSDYSEISIHFSYHIDYYVLESTLHKTSSIRVAEKFRDRPYYIPDEIKRQFKRFVLLNTHVEGLSNFQEGFLEDLVTFVETNSKNADIFIVVSTRVGEHYGIENALERLLGENFDKFVVLENFDDDAHRE